MHVSEISVFQERKQTSLWVSEITNFGSQLMAMRDIHIEPWKAMSHEYEQEWVYLGTWLG